VVDVRNDGDVANLVHVAGFVGQPLRLPPKAGEAPALQLRSAEYGGDHARRQPSVKLGAVFGKRGGQRR
jgi:hypothetical protein